MNICQRTGIMPKLFIFDVDGTLVEKFSCMFLNGVEEWRAANPDALCAIATNQGGVGLNYWMKSGGFGNPDRYTNEEQVTTRLNKIAELLAIPANRIYVAFRYQSQKSGQWSPTPYDVGTTAANVAAAYNEKDSPMMMAESGEDRLPVRWRKDWRKPQPGMLLAAMQGAGVTPADTVFVGDSVEDKKAAQAAGVTFINADEFFGRK